MAEPLKIRFATDTEGARKGIQDLAASVISSMVKVSGAIANNSEAVSAGLGKIIDTSDGVAKGVAKAAGTVVSDLGKIGAAGIKAANETGSIVGIGAAVTRAASDTKTGSAIMQGSMAAARASYAANSSIIRKEVAQTATELGRSPLFSRVGSAVGALASIPGLTAIAGSIAAYYAVDAAVKAATESVAEFVKIGNEAASAGVGTDFLQRWKGQATELRVEVDALTKMLDHAREASTSRIGEGDNASSSPIQDRLKQNVLAGNLSKADANTFDAAQGQEARIRVILDLVDQLRAKGDQLAAFDLANKMFGSTFEQKLRDGIDATGQMRTALNSLSTTAGGARIVSPEEIENAEAITRQLGRISDLLESGIAPIQRDLIKLGQDQYKGWLDIKESIAGAVAQVGRLYEAVKPVLALLDKITGANPLGTLATALGATHVRDALGIKGPDPAYGAPDESRRNKTGGAAPAQLPEITVVGDKSNTLPSLKGKGGGGAGATEDQTTALERYIEQLTKANGLAQSELDTLGQGNVVKEREAALVRASAAATQDYNSGKRDSATLTEAEIASVRKWAEATATVKDKLMDLKQQQQLNAEAMRSFGQAGSDALSDIVFESKNANAALADLAKTLGKQVFNSLLTGQGAFAGILGTAAPASAGTNAVGGLFGQLGSLLGIGKNAEGTDNWRGGPTWVGERGPEIVNLPKGAQVVPNNLARSMKAPTVASSAPSMVSTTIALGDTHIDARGATMSEGQFKAILAQNNRAQEAKLADLIKDGRGRGSIR